jgi:isocitrate lyase
MTGLPASFGLHLARSAALGPPQLVKHQRFVGAAYFDQVAQAITAGGASTCALEGSTEEEQFAVAVAGAR